MNKNFHNFLIGVSVLPVLAIMPAMATVSITADTNLNEDYADGVIQELLRSQSGYVGTFTTPNISITDSVTSGEKNYLVLVANDGSALNFGTAENPVESINVEYTGPGTRAFTVWDDGVANLYGNNITISAQDQGFVTWGDHEYDTHGSATIVGNNISISAANALYVNDGTDVTVRSQTLDVSGGDGISAWGAWEGNTYVEGGIIDIDTNDLNVNVTGTGISANYGKSQITIDAEGDVNVVARGSDDTRAIHAGNATVDPDIAKTDTSFVSITARNINLTADNIGISAMSNGWVDLDGNLTVSARDAILARGQATVNVNASGEHTVKMDGNLAFDYYGANSGSGIDAKINVILNGTDSYWNGNTLVSYGYYTAYQKDGEGNPLADEHGDLLVQRDTTPTTVKMQVNSTTVSLQNGAVWNATQIQDRDSVVRDVQKIGNIEYPADLYSGQYYNALNNLNIDNGTVNIADTTRGIVVENANIKDATFNGGKLNIGAMTLSGGTNTFNNNVVGIDNASALTIANGATMNIGTNTVNVANITLDGTMLATLRDGDAQITAGTFGGDGTLKLSLAGAGTYHVFGDSTFRAAGIDATSSVYDISWANEDKDLVATLKSVEDIAAENEIAKETAAAVAGATQSSSEKLTDLGVKMQEKLAEATPEARQEVEKAVKAVHPETESVTQSVATSVQTTVSNLVAARMAAPISGRNGGDVNFTSGGVWTQGLFNKSKQNDAFHGYTRGIAAGLDGTINRAWTIGAGYSFAHSDISGSVRDTEIDSNTIFVYGQYKPYAWYVSAMLNYTMSDFSEKGVAMGTPVTADYDVDSFGGMLATGYDFDIGVTPELGLRYLHVNGEDYTNSMDVKSKLDSADYLTASLGAKYGFGILTDSGLLFRPELRAAAKYDLMSDDTTATVTMPGVNAYTLEGERLSRFGGEFGIGLSMKYRSMDISVNYDLDVRKDYTSQTGMLKFRYNF